MPSASGAARIARTADGLTATRIALAVAIGILAAERAFEAATISLCVAWITDFLDGRVARRTPEATRLGDYDMAVDTFVGAMLVAGVGVGGIVPAWIAIAALAVFGVGYLVLRQAALSMALQGVGYGALLWQLWAQRNATLWVAVATIVTIAAFEGRKLVRVVLPEFFHGAAETVRFRRADGKGLRRY